MIPPRDAKTLEILKQPRTLLSMSQADQTGVLDFLAGSEFCVASNYFQVYRGQATAYVLAPTMLSQQISALRNMFAEWPSLLIDVVVLSLEARTGTPSAKWLASWRSVSEHNALLGAGDGILRLAEIRDSRGEQISAHASRDDRDQRGLPPPANPEIWDAACRIKRSCIWMLTAQHRSEIRDRLEKLLEPMSPSSYWERSESAAVLWALAQFRDEDAVNRLKRLMKLPQHAGKVKVLRRYVESIEHALGNLPVAESQETRFLSELATSGYVIAEAMARALSVMDDRPSDLRALCRLLADADGPRPPKVWTAGWKKLRGDSLDPLMEKALVGVVSAYNEIATVRPLISMAEFEASAFYEKTGEEQPGNPAARGMAQRTRELDRVYGTGIPNIKEVEASVKNAARGALWALAGARDPGLCQLFAQTVIAWSKLGVSNPVVAYAAIYALSRAGGAEAVVHLQELRARIKHKNLAKRIEAAFADAAKAQGLSPDELADQLVPDHGLDECSSRDWPAGTFTLRLALGPDGKVEIRTLDAARKSIRKLPGESARAYAAELAVVRAERKALSATVSLQRARLEGAMVAGRRWPLESWRRAFAQHPLLKSVAQRVVWRIDMEGETTGIGMPTTENAWIDVNGAPFDVPNAAVLSIVHPVDLKPENQAAWQRRIVAQHVIQPFKQLFRETYYPTESERNGFEVTRYRGHIVPLQLLRALTASRGWVGGLGLAGFDGSGQGSRSFKSFGVEAWLYHDGKFESDEARIELTEFRPIAAASGGPLESPIKLAEVPPLVFSEAVRDVDLVASVGSVGVGELGVPSATSEALASAFGLTRASTIAALIPSLGLAGRVAVDGSYAIIDKRFRVHLGTATVTRYPSGERVNFSMSQRIARDVSLPFEDRDDALTILINVILTLANHE
jgi:hypothetical protein